MTKTTKHHLATAALCVWPLWLCACSNTSELLKAPSGLVTGTIEKIQSIPIPALPEADPEPTGSPTEIYTRIARGATVCWFGAHGALKRSHIFHAEAEPPAKGGRSEIIIHEKDSVTPNPRGNRAFRVLVTPSGDTATVEAENSRFPLETGQRMRSDVRRWARGDLRCGDANQTKGWEPQQKPPEPETPNARPKSRERQT